MTLDLFHHFKTSGNYGDQTTSSVARAQLKAWDQKYESQPSWEEVTCGQSVMGVDDCGILPEEKWEYIKNPSLSTKEIWQLCADESADERADRYGHRYDDYDPWDDYDPYYDYDPFREYDYEFPHQRMMEEADSPPSVFFIHELEKESEKYIEDCKVWHQTVEEIAQFEERPCTPEPEPRITNHHYRKAA